MKIWEKIKQNFNDCKDMDREQIESVMYGYRYTPCDCNPTHNFISPEKLNEICVGRDCYACLKMYLDTEVPNAIHDQ